MASKYNNGKIYKIVGQCGLIYIGSTTKKLYDRLTIHKSKYKRFLDGKSTNYLTSFEVFKSGEYKIELIEEFACDSKDELTAREGHYIRKMDCVNKIIPGRTMKEWYEDNKEKKKEYLKEYYQQNKEKLNVKQKEYNKKNKEWRNQKNECPCGGSYSNNNKSQHLKTKLHQNYINSLN